MGLSTNSNGSAMVIVLAITSILFLGCLFLVKVAKEAIRASQAVVDKLDAQIQAESAIEAFKFLGSTGVFTTNRLLTEFGTRIGLDREIPLDGTVISFGKDARIQALDAGAKLNIWSIDPLNLDRLIGQVGGTEEKIRVIQDSILDWFDKDDLNRLNGAESYYYQKERRLKYGPRNIAFSQCVEELSLIKGLNDKELWSKIKDHFLLAPDSRPNINTMDRKLLCAVLGISDETADHLLALRRSKGFLTFLDVGAITGRDSAYLSDMLTGIASSVVELKTGAVSGDAREVIHCIISFKPNLTSPYRILELTY